MKIITRQTLANEAPSKFEMNYADARRSLAFWKQGETKGSIIDQLNALKSPINPDDVDAIIGNTSWTEVPPCDECGSRGLPHVVQIGQEPDYESATANVCSDCLHAALIKVKS